MIEKNTAYLAVFCFIMGLIFAGTIGYLVNFAGSLEYQSRLAEYSQSDRELRDANRLLDAENTRLEQGIAGLSKSIGELSIASQGLSGQGANFAKELRRIAGLIKEIAERIAAMQNG